MLREPRDCKYCKKPINEYARKDAIYCSDSCRVSDCQERKELQRTGQYSRKERVNETEIKDIYEQLESIGNDLEVIDNKMSKLKQKCDWFDVSIRRIKA